MKCQFCVPTMKPNINMETPVVRVRFRLLAKSDRTWLSLCAIWMRTDLQSILVDEMKCWKLIDAGLKYGRAGYSRKNIIHSACFEVYGYTDEPVRVVCSNTMVHAGPKLDI